MPGQVVVRVHSGALQASTASVSEPFEWLAREAGAHRVEPLFDSESDELRGVTLIELTEPVSAELLQRVEASPAIAFAEPVPARWLSAAAAADPSRNRQWGLRAIRWFESARPAPDDVTVAICDTGVDAAHPDLEGAVAAYDHEGMGAADIVGHGTHVSGIIAARPNNDAGIVG